MIHSFRGTAPTLHATAFIAWNAVVAGSVSVAEGASVWYGAVARGDMAPISIGRDSNIQDCAVLHTVEGGPCIVGDGVTVGHGAIVHACTVGNHSLIGMGAILLDGAVIGEESIVGAGALVTQGKKFPPRSMILGSPAKVVRSLTEDEIASLREHAIQYVELSAATKAEGGGTDRYS